MNKKHVKGWLKHWDFILIDILCLQLSFIFGYWLVGGLENPYKYIRFQYQAILLFVCQLIIILFSTNYRGILRRRKMDELFAVTRYMGEILILAIGYMFLTHDTAIASRLQIGFTSVIYVLLDTMARCLNRRRVIRSVSGEKGKKSLMLVTSSQLVEETLKKLYKKDVYRDFIVTRIVLLDQSDLTSITAGDTEIPVSVLSEETVHEISHDWVDEAFIMQPDDMLFPVRLMDDLMTMGISVNYTVSALNNDRWPNTDVRKLGEYKVLTNSVRFANAGQLAIKRIMDVLGGLVGCLFTGILCIFIAPAIYIADPGPIFFTQERVGQNGKTFKLHKFRSMYMDAEARKAELMEKNKIKDGMMFKLDDDPRIIGSEKKNKDGKPIGIGNIIREWSLDEFPQFFDVLIGNMSLVGWRPCTLEEWKQYDLQHRIRASMKPGITGMWQVSGRSQITDFDEVVRLDREYIENWDILLDIRILIRTVAVVLRRQGAE